MRVLALSLLTIVGLSSIAQAQDLKCSFSIGSAKGIDGYEPISKIVGEAQGKITNPIKPNNIGEIFSDAVVPTLHGNLSASAWLGVDMPKEGFPKGRVISLAFDLGKVRIASSSLNQEGYSHGHFVLGSPADENSVRVSYYCGVR